MNDLGGKQRAGQIFYRGLGSFMARATKRDSIGACAMNDVNDVNSHQVRLNAEQIAEFYHDEFADAQLAHFLELEIEAENGVVVDVGGGVGYFAQRLRTHTSQVPRVLDMDPVSIERCRESGLQAYVDDALSPTFRGDEDVVCFNLILHHLVSKTESETRALQVKALSAWLNNCRIAFVNEYIYESYLGNFSGWLIYQITSSKTLSLIGKFIARFVPALRANTFGIGVRFRAHREWRDLFHESGFKVVDQRIGFDENVRWPLRFLLIKSIRRDSFRIEAA